MIKLQFATTGTDFGDLFASKSWWNLAHQIQFVQQVGIGGGLSPTYRDTIDFVTITSAGNATDFGNLTSFMKYYYLMGII